MLDMQNRRMGMDASNPGSAMAGVSASGGRAVDVSKFTKFINWCLYALVFITPLLFLPFTSEVREFNKQAALFFLVVLMLGIWVIKILTTRSVSWVKTSLDYVVLAYGLVYLLASFLSLDKPSSFLGYYGRFTGSFVSVLTLVVLYYIIVNNVTSTRLANKLVKVTMVSGAIVMVYSFFQLLGVYILPFAFAKSRSFNPIGSLGALAIFTAIMLVFTQWSWTSRQNVSKLHHAFYTVMTLLGLVILFLINSSVSWIILALGLIAFLALAMVQMSSSTNSATWFWKPLLVLVVAVLFIGFRFLPSVNPRRAVSVNLPVEIQLSNSANWNLVKNALSNKPILGYGPGTTGLAFGEIKPESINKSIVWNLNFDRASSQIASIAIETGLLGLLVFEATSILFLLYALFFLLKKQDHPGHVYAFGFFLVWLTLYISHFFYFFNTTFDFLFWFSLAMVMAISHWQGKQSEDSNMAFSTSPRQALSWMFASLIVLAALLVGTFFEVTVYTGEAAYASGLKELNKSEPNFARADDQFRAAVTRNQYRDTYYLAYAQNLIFRASQEAAKKDPDVQQFYKWIDSIVRSANSATTVSPDKASNWSARAQFFGQLRSLAIAGTDEAIISSWEKAGELDSKNPAIQIRLAQAYANAAQSIDPKIAGEGADADSDGLSDAQETFFGSNSNSKDSNGNGAEDGDEVKAGFNPKGAGRLTDAQLSKFIKIDESKLKKAEDALKQSMALKNDLPDTYVALSRVYEQWNKLDEAQKQLDAAAAKFPSNVDVRYEQGRIQFNRKQVVEAEKTFNAIVKAVPDHANAHFSLGLIHNTRGSDAKKANQLDAAKTEFGMALAEFEKTREITGPNVTVEKFITDLKTELGQPTQ